MSPASPYRFPLIAIGAVLLLPLAWREYQWATGGEFSNTFGLLAAIYGAYYAVVAGMKAFNTWRGRGAAAGAPDAAWMFLGAGALVLTNDVMSRWFQFPLRAVMPDGAVLCLFAGVMCLGVFGPWLALLKMEKYRHLRAQGMWGLVSLLLLPLGLLALTIAVIVLQLRWLLPCAAAACLCFWLARRVSGKWLLRAGAAVLAALLLCIAAYWWHLRPYNAAEAAAEQRDYNGAINILRPLAEDGSAKAAFQIGLYYTAAMNPKPDAAEGVKWLMTAANNGSVFSAWLVARAYMDGEGVEKNPVEAVKWLNRAASEGETGAQMALADYYIKGEGGLPQDAAQAAAWLERAGNQGQPGAYTKLYWFYRKGAAGMKPDYAKAYFWYLVWSDYQLHDSFFKSCPVTKEKKPEEQGMGMTFRDMTMGMGRKNCEDDELRPLLTEGQISAAKARKAGWKPRPENFWAHFSF